LKTEESNLQQLEVLVLSTDRKYEPNRIFTQQKN